MSDESEREVGYELMVPFVVASDHGGPYDAEAFTAGWEMGQLWQRCHMLDALDVPAIWATIRRGNLPQADLIAMHFGRTCAEIREDEPDLTAEWACVVIGTDENEAPK